jgi:hypothetical protein
MRTKSRFFLCATVTSINALVSAGFAIATLAQLHFADKLAMYGVARSVPIAVAVLAIAWSGSIERMLLLCFLSAGVQLCDALVGLNFGDVEKTVGPLFFAIFTAMSGILLSRRDAKNGTNSL